MSLPAASFTAFSFIHTHSPSQVRRESLVWFSSRAPAPCVTTGTIATNHLASSSTRLTASLTHPAVRNYNLAIFPQVPLGTTYFGLATAQALEREHHSCPSPRSCRRRLVQVGDMILHRFHNFFEGSLPVWDHQRQEVATESGGKRKIGQNRRFCLQGKPL